MAGAGYRIAAAVLGLLSASDAADSSPKPIERFLRFVSTGENEGFLDTAIVSYRSADGTRTLDLVPVVHVADQGYYEAIQRTVAECDLVLLEPIEAEGPDEVSSSDRLPRLVTEILGLVRQVDLVWPTGPPYVYLADKKELPALNDEEVHEAPPSENQKTEGVIRPLLNVLESLRETCKKDPSLSRRIKVSLARRLVLTLAERKDNENAPGGVESQQKRSLGVLERVRESFARGAKRIAIVYGAAHIVEIKEGLVRDLTLEARETRWVHAWSMVIPPIVVPSAGGADSKG